MSGITYDTGALIAAEGNDRRMWALHRRALERGNAPTVPAPVVVEAWRNGVAMARMLDGCHLDDLDGVAAKNAGLLLGRCSEPVEATDAAVVEGALRRYDTVVTSNRSHLEALAAGGNRRLGIIDI
jgi:hypothetical protein